MRLLVVEGNPREIWEKRKARGGIPYHKRFQSMLKLLQPKAKIEVAFPADKDAFLPSIKKLASFDGVMWTGSSSCVYDPSPAVVRQLTFAEDVFRSGVPLYGSCWGLQIAVTVTGGKVDNCAKGRELGITDPVELTEAGKVHPCFQGRKSPFKAFSVHSDEVIKLPDYATILAKNSHSDVQALAIKHRKTDFFGVQYHPEFTIEDMAFTARYASVKLIKDGFFKSDEDIEVFVANLEQKNNLPESISDYSLHTQEVRYWIDYAVNDKKKNNYSNDQMNK